MTSCPERGCDAPWTTSHRWIAESSDGPVEMERGECAAGHWFAASVDVLEASAKENLV